MESLKEITLYYHRNFRAGFDAPEKGVLQGKDFVFPPPSLSLSLSLTLNTGLIVFSLFPLEENIRLHSLRNAGTVLGTHLIRPDIGPTTANPTTTLKALGAFGSRSQRFTQDAAKEGSKLLTK